MNYTVKQGDTLQGIARVNRINLAALLDLNPGYRVNPSRIRVGDRLRLPMAAPAPAARPATQPVRTGSELGSLSAKYETGGRGPGTVSSGAGDAGGVSYGSYQMTSTGGGTVGRFISQPDFPWRSHFLDLTPGSEEFSRQWREIARTQPSEFQASQHAYIQRTHYDPLVAKIRRDDGLDIDARSFALRNVIWSTAVQHGPGTAIVHRTLKNLLDGGRLNVVDPEFDRNLIKAIYAERGRRNVQGNLAYFPRNSRAVQQGVARRFTDEEKDALKLV